MSNADRGMMSDEVRSAAAFVHHSAFIIQRSKGGTL